MLKKLGIFLLVFAMLASIAVAGFAAENETAGLVVDVAELKAGDQIAIVAKSEDVAMSTTQNTNNRGYASVTKDGNTVTLSANVQVITLEEGTVAGTFAFKVDAGYLYAASSSKNYLKTQTSKDDNASWEISIAVDGTATIKAKGGNARNWLRWNTSNDIFSCYGSGQLDVAIYKIGYAGGVAGEIEYTSVTVQGAQDAADDTFVEVKGLVTNVYYSSIYIQDDTGAIKVTLGANAQCKIGDTVIVKGVKSGSGIVSATYEASEGMTLVAKPVALADLATLDAGTYVTLAGVAVSEVILNDDETMKGFSVSDGEITLTTSGNLTGSDALKVGDLVTLFGTLSDATDALKIWNVTYGLKTEESEEPSESEVTEKFSYEIVSPTKINTVFGFYEDRTGADENTFVDGNDGKCVTDGWYGRAGYSECTSANGLIALIMELDEVTTLGAIEIVGKNAANNAVDFDIQAWVDGAWVTVLSVDEDPFTSGLTVKFTFDKPVDTNKVRILVNKVSVETEQCYFMEVSLFEAKAGDVKNTLDLNGKVTTDNAHASHPATGLVNGDKSDIVLFSNAEIDLTNNGEPTAIDGFALYYYRGGQTEAKNITVLVKLTADGEFEAIGQFATGFESKVPQDSLFVTFDQTYNAYAVMLATDEYGYVTEFELFQFEREVEPEDPTDPSEPENPENPEDPTEKQTATLVEGLNDGDKIVIFYNNGNTVIGDTLDSDGKRLNPVEATFDGEKLVIGEGMLVLTVDIDENNQITFITEDGKYLTSGETGNSVSLADAASAYSLWVLEEKDNGFFIKNVNAAYSGKAQYLEYYKGFTTYGYTDGSSDAALYTYNFYLLSKADVEDPTDPEPTDPETTEPEATEPEATEPEATEPEATEPDQPGKTGNTTLSVLVGMLALSAIGGGILISKKKEF